MDGQLVKDLEGYANSFDHGFLKEHKANSLLWTLVRAPAIMEDEVRFLAFLKNSLAMEGFQSQDIELIMGWLYERKEEIAA